MTYNELLLKLDSIGQKHLLQYYEELSDEQQQTLISQIEQLDFSMISNIDNDVYIRSNIEPIDVLQLDDIEIKQAYYTDIGINAIRNNKVGAVLLAGGMGTRLGSDLPKGAYNIGITKDLYIFECLFNNLMKNTSLAGNPIYLFIMTSDKNYDDTVRFLEEHSYFGYPKEYVKFFKQEMAPAVDFNGKVLLEEKYKVATSPNGYGGWLVSMNRTGMMDIVRSNGIEWLNIFAVDNVLQNIADPTFIGACIDSSSTVGAKVVRKVNPEEKVGVMCLEDGKPSIIEYFELTEDMRYQKNNLGEYDYNFGVILNYLFSVKELEKFISQELPYHITKKKIEYIDDLGNKINPIEPNGYKFEQLALDMINKMEKCLPYEVLREKEFAPIKNKEGNDSIDSARILLTKNGIIV